MCIRDSSRAVESCIVYTCKSTCYSKWNQLGRHSRVCGTAGIPECRGDSELVSGESTKLICELPYSGTSSPALTWTRNGEQVPSRDESGFGEESLLSASSISLDAVGPDDDNATYQCQLEVADVVVHRYSVTLDVACESS